MRTRAAVGIVALLLMMACGGAPAAAPQPSTPAPAELSVFAAASLTDAFTDMGRRFEAANPGVTVRFNFAGSQQLAQQIAQGAPADVFASANAAQMKNVIGSGQVVGGSERTFVRNRLVVIYPKDNPAQLAALADLARPGLKLVFADRAVPAGQYSLDFLAKASKLPEYTETYSPTVLSNVVSYEESVRVVLGKVALGEADAGIVYGSDITGENADMVGRIDIADELNVIATYPIAPVAGSRSADLARRFIDYVLSPDGQATLAEYGFIPAT